MKTPTKYLTLILGLLAVVALGLYFDLGGLNTAVAGGALLATLPGAITLDPETQKKLVAGVEKAANLAETAVTKTEKVLQDYDRLDKETKKAFEDITSLKKTANDSAADQQKILAKITEIQERVRMQARSAFGNPIQRISQDEDLRLRFNAAIRLAVNDPSGDQLRAVRKHFPESFVKRALGEDTSPGSTLINNALAQEIYDTLADFGVWNTFAVRRLGTKITKYPVKTARPVANFILTEGGTIADDTNKAGTSVNLEAEVIGVLLNVSRQLLDDAEFDVTADILDDFAAAFALRLDHAALNADGTADAANGGMTGIFQGGTASVATTGRVTVEQTQDSDWRAALLAVDPVVLARGARWWLHPQILVRMLGIKDSNGRPIFLTANEAPTPGGIGSIFGYPVSLALAAPSTNAANSKVAVFGDPNANVVGIRNDFAFEASDHHRWNTYERSFRGIGRAGTRIRRSAGLAVVTLPAS